MHDGGQQVAASFRQAAFLPGSLVFERSFDSERQACGAVFENVIRGASLNAFDGELLSDGAGYQDERKIFAVLLERLQGRHSRPARQVVIGQDHVIGVFPQRPREFFGGSDNIDHRLVARLFEPSDAELGILRAVFDVEHPPRLPLANRARHLQRTHSLRLDVFQNAPITFRGRRPSRAAAG